MIARFGLFEADLHRRVLTREGLRVKLQDQPFEILGLLLQRPGEIVSREEIQQKLWPADTYVAFDDGLNTAIKKLRLALGDSADNPRFIETVPRRGYRFLAAPMFADTAKNFGEGTRLPAVASNPPNDGEGGALKAGSNRRVALWIGSLVAATLLVTGWMLWGKRVSGHVASESASISRGLSSQQPSRRAGHVITPRAREEFLQARSYWKLRTAEALGKTVDHYNLAIELDPDYAEAYAALANTYIVLPMLSTVSTDDAYLKARQAAGKALALDNSLAEAHLAAAEINFYADWNFPAAEKEFRRAVELDSNAPQAHQWYAEFLSLMGRHQEAIAQIQIAEHLDPSSMIIHHQAGQILQAARKYSDAILEYRQALMIQPGFGPTYSMIALAYRRLGRIPECVEADRQANAYWNPAGPSADDLRRVLQAYRSGGKQAYFRAALDYGKARHASSYQLAYYYALLRQEAQALQQLQTALETHNPEILNLQNDPEFDYLRSDPRFQEIAKKVGLTQAAGVLATCSRCVGNM